jgi:hypothetical protein
MNSNLNFNQVTQISFGGSIADENEETNPINDYRSFSLACSVWIYDEKFCAKLCMFANRGSKETSFGLERTPLIKLVDFSESNWPDLYRQLSSSFQNIVLGRPLLQFLLNDFYSEDRYEQFKNVATKKLQEHSLEHLIQP